MKLFKKIAVSLALVGALCCTSLAPTANALNVTKNGSEDSKVLTNDANKSNDLPTLIRTVISTLFFILGIAAVLIIIFGGFRYVTANGDGGQIKSAKDTILYACVGLVVAILSYAIVQFVLSRFSGNGS